MISICLATGAHAKIKKYLFASVLSAIASSIVFQIIGYFILGYLDPFFLIALFTGALVSLVIALLTGVPFLIFRNKRR
jgi:membrane protein DedA with SNARE-associated domain